jgi:peptidoglycan/LPS O-acetylase OafA/YrhL
MELTTRLGYRAEIDGLRAIAVLSVLAFHYGAPLPGGFTGVDVFFVISGFLITQILAGEIAAGTFSVLGFYDRRMRRILPALLAMLATVLLAGRFLLMPGDYASLGKSTAAAAFGVSNFYFLNNTGYFDRAADFQPLLHTWSLAVEEQFYVVWPLLLLGLSRIRSKLALAVTLAAFVTIGAAASIVYFDIEPKSAFYMALPRAWELGLGALLAFLPALPRMMGELATVAGLALVAAGFHFISPNHFPGMPALAPCLGAALVIWPRTQPTFSGRLLGLLAPIGLISYSLYLWHWPIWVLFRTYLGNRMPNHTQAIVLAVASIIISAASHRYVEQRFRKRRWSPPQTVAAGLAAIMTMFCAAMYVDSSDGLPQRIPPAGLAMRSLAVMWEWPCNQVSIETIPDSYCVFGAPWKTAKRKTLIWGDSHAQHFAPILDAINDDAERSFLVYASCPAVLGDGNDIFPVGAPQYPDYCRRQHANAVKLLREDTAIDQVLFTANWLEVPGRINDKGDAAYGVEAMRSALTKIFNEAATPDRRFILVGMVPQLPLSVVECAHQLHSSLLRAPCSATIQGSDARVIGKQTDFIDAMFVELAKTFPSVTAVIPADRLCRNDTCEVSMDGEFLWRDAGHIRRNLRLQTRRDFAERIGLSAALADSGHHDATALPASPGIQTR